MIGTAADTAPVFAIVAGESSSDTLAAGLIRSLHKRWPAARFIGVTGPAMRSAGCESLGDIDDLSLFGVGEVLLQLPRLVRFRAHVARSIAAAGATVFIGVDAPAFNLGLASRLKQQGIATVQYVCPTAWAWREGRTRRIRRSIDLLLAIFPFEPAFFARFGINARFVGHPLADQAGRDDSGRLMARTALELDDEATVVGLLPGSRTSEVDRLAPVFLNAALCLARRGVAATFVIPVAHDGLESRLSGLVDRIAPALDVRLTGGGARPVLQAVDVALVASGTATLEAVMADTPMVVAYRLSIFNAALVRAFRLIRTPYVSIPNLLANRAVVPEYLQSAATADALCDALESLFDEPLRRENQQRELADIRRSLVGDTDAHAAAAVTELVESRT